MNINRTAHRLFLMVMLIVCATAVAVFVKQRANASLDSTISGTGVATAAPINGTCSSINGKTVTSKPTVGLCSTGSQSVIVETNTGWAWKCEGVSGGLSQYCSVNRYIQNTTTGSVPTTTTIAPVEPIVAAPTVTTAATPVADGARTVEAAPTPAVVLNSEESPATTNSGESENSGDAQKKAVAKVVVSPEKGSVVETVSSAQQQMEESRGPASEPSLERIGIEKSQIVSQAVVVEAKNLAKSNNPKISGAISKSLMVKGVALEKREDGNGNIRMEGKAEPNALVTIYIFSNDPVVITIKADAEGNWNYELDKELADGQHEAYIAVTDEAGKIISKSEPIAFVKTAQAATVIPVSALTANQSPIERSAQQYVLMAIVIMSVCLAIALVLIGFLTHGRKLDEGIN